MNWIALLADRFKASFGDEPPDVRAAVLRSLYGQGKFLRANLERHLDGNHLFKNAAALYTLGSYFEGKEADEWRSTARQMLDALAAYHFLPDGGHFERSPMYHALALVDLLHVLNIAGEETWGANGQAHVKVAFDRRELADRYLSILRDVLGREAEITVALEGAGR